MCVLGGVVTGMDSFNHGFPPDFLPAIHAQSTALASTRTCLPVLTTTFTLCPCCCFLLAPSHRQCSSGMRGTAGDAAFARTFGTFDALNLFIPSDF